MADIYKTSPDMILLGERAQQLDMLLHVQEFSAMAVLITGASEMGKTALLETAATQLSVHHQTIVLTGFEVNQLPTLIDAIALQLGCAANLVDLDTQLSQIAAQQETLHVLIDDAHLLDDDALQVLLEKSTLEHGWHLILCGDESLKDRLNGLQSQFENKLYHLIELLPFTEEESEAFIAQVYKRSGLEVLPLSMKDIHQLWLLSKGVPGKLLELIELEQDHQTQKTGRFPIGHLAAVCLIVSALIVSYMYQDQASEIDDEDAIAMLVREKQQSLQKMQDAKPKSNLNEAKEASINHNEEVITDNQEPHEVDLTQAELDMSEEQDMDTPIEPETAAAPIPKRVETAPTAQGKIASKPIANTAQNQRKPAVSSHPLLQAPSQSFALQLLGVRNEENAKAFVKRFSREMDSSKLSIYETRHKGEPWFVVVYGPIDSKDLANQQAKTLSKTIKGQPWVRPISKIQADIREIPKR